MALGGFTPNTIMVVGGFYLAVLGFFWLTRHAPYTALFIIAFLSGLLGGGRRRRW